MNGTVTQNQQIPPPLVVTHHGSYGGGLIIPTATGPAGMVLQGYHPPINAATSVAENSTRVIEAFVANHPIQKQHSVEHISGSVTMTAVIQENPYPVRDREEDIKIPRTGGNQSLLPALSDKLQQQSCADALVENTGLSGSVTDQQPQGSMPELMSESHMEEGADATSSTGLSAASPTDPSAAGQQDQYLQQVRMLTNSHVNILHEQGHSWHSITTVLIHSGIILLHMTIHWSFLDGQKEAKTKSDDIYCPTAGGHGESIPDYSLS